MKTGFTNKKNLGSAGKNLAAIGTGILVAKVIPAPVSNILGLCVAAYGIHKAKPAVFSLGTSMMLTSPASLETPPKSFTEEFKAIPQRAKGFYKEFLPKVFVYPKEPATPSLEGLGFTSGNPEQALAEFNQSLIATAMDYQEGSEAASFLPEPQHQEVNGLNLATI